jgi:hypothetical protein
MKKKYFVILKASHAVIVDDAESLEEAKEIVSDMYIEDDLLLCGYDNHYEWDIVHNSCYEFEDEEKV